MITTFCFFTLEVIVPLVNSSSFNFSDPSGITGDELQELGRDVSYIVSF